MLKQWFAYNTLSAEMFALRRRVGNLFQKTRLAIAPVSQVGVPISIDNDTNLPEVSVKKLLTTQTPAQAIAVPEQMVQITRHPLSVPSSDPNEAPTYETHQFRAPEMTLERLQDQYWFPEPGFVVSTEGRVWRHSILGQYGDPNFLMTYAVARRDNAEDGEYLFYENLLEKAPVIDDLRLITSHYASHNYGHFLLDMVPLIRFGAMHGLRMITRPLLPWHQAIYQRAGINMKRVEITNARVLRFRDVIVSNRHNAVSTYAASPQIREVYAEILANVPRRIRAAAKAKRLFLSRGDTKSRILRNAPALTEALKGAGFTVVRPETLSFDEQAAMFEAAEVIVSEFGAVMANVVFCRAGTKIVEIIPESQKDPWSAHLCAALGLEHVTVFHRVKDEDRQSLEFGGRAHTNIYFSYDADIPRIMDIVAALTK